MQFRNLGNTGLQVSALALGTWLNVGQRLDSAESLKLLSTAYDNGVNLFDTAENYGWGEAQISLGSAIRALGWPRDTYIISSKAFYGSRRDDRFHPTQRGLSRKHLVDSCNDALARLRLDYIDLYLCHAYDPRVDISEIVWTMHSLIMQGKILHWGTSKWTAAQIQEARDIAFRNNLIAPVVEQPEYNLVATEVVENDLADLVDSCGIGLISWSPLKQGILAGRYGSGIAAGSRFSFSDIRTLKDQVPEAQFDSWLDFARRMEKFSTQLGVSTAQLAIAWCLKNRLLSSVLLGCSSASQLMECLQAVYISSRMSSEIWLQLHELRRIEHGDAEAPISLEEQRNVG